MCEQSKEIFMFMRTISSNIYVCPNEVIEHLCFCERSERASVSEQYKKIFLHFRINKVFLLFYIFIILSQFEWNWNCTAKNTICIIICI